MDSITLRNKMMNEGLSVKDGNLSQRYIHLERALKIVIPPKNQSDRTCFRRVVNWLKQKCSQETFIVDEIMPRVVDFALEASSPEARNPAAVFMSIMKKELGYPN